MITSVLITGANAGIGKEVARQMATKPGMECVILACRDDAKARAARADLERSTGRSCFQNLKMDVADVASVRSALQQLQGPIDACVMNAGGTGGKTPFALTASGVTQIFAANVLGHAVLLENLLASGKLTKVAVYVGSEAARGVPKLGIKRPVLPTSSVQDFTDIITGKSLAGKKSDSALAYAEVKYSAALWMAEMAREHPLLRLLTVSPGNTQGTQIARSLPAPARFLMQRVVMPFVAPIFGLAHSLETGAGRVVDALTGTALQSGRFFASAETKLTGPLVDQSTIFADLASPEIQRNATEAIHRFV